MYISYQTKSRDSIINLYKEASDKQAELLAKTYPSQSIKPISLKEKKATCVNYIKKIATQLIEKADSPLQKNQRINTLKLAIKLIQDGVNNGNDYFTNTNHYGSVDNKLLEDIMNPEIGDSPYRSLKTALSLVCAHRSILPLSQTILAGTNYTRSADKLRSFLDDEQKPHTAEVKKFRDLIIKNTKYIQECMNSAMYLFKTTKLEVDSRYSEVSSAIDIPQAFKNIIFDNENVVNMGWFNNYEQITAPYKERGHFISLDAEVQIKSVNTVDQNTYECEMSAPLQLKDMDIREIFNLGRCYYTYTVDDMTRYTGELKNQKLTFELEDGRAPIVISTHRPSTPTNLSLNKKIKSSPDKVVIDANGNNYIKIEDNVFDGNCGLQAYSKAFNSNLEFSQIRKNMVKLSAAYVDIQEQTEAMTPDEKKIAQAYKTIFGGDINKFRSFINIGITDNLSNTQDHKTIDSLKALQERLEDINNFECLTISDCQECLKYDLGVETQDNLCDKLPGHNLQKFYSTHKMNQDKFTPEDFTKMKEEYKKIATKNYNWLNLNELKMLALSDGFRIDSYILSENPVLNSHTIIRFENLLDKNDHRYIANNVPPSSILLNNQADIGEGTHWIAVSR